MRILAGTFKGRRLLSPPKGAATRPITGLARESLFGMLSPRLAGAVVADLYCGTGTIGLEALSRGAERACFAERDRGVLARLRRNVETLGVGERCRIWAGNIERRLPVWLAGLEGSLDVAFVDPPYADVDRWSWDRVTEAIFTPLAGALAADGIVALRVPARTDLPGRLGALAVERLKRYGDMRVALLRPERDE